MRFDVLTLFPEMFDGFLSTSIVGRAKDEGHLHVRFKTPRDFGLGRHKNVDDTPYGGGSGMVMRVDVMVAAMEAFDAELGDAPKSRRVLLTPQGRPLVQTDLARFAALPAVMLVCGRYEGFDERVRSFVDEEVSLGDFVLTGGELAAMVVIDGTIRLLPGVLGNDDSSREESHSPATGGRLEYPHYTRPASFRGLDVPAVLASGNHAEIERFRTAESIRKTRERRPDLVTGDAGSVEPGSVARAPKSEGTP
ncbi:MAG: tRNA (guanosine(37)-N1)-methyltransferase TrmD [Polyangiaceae bacterium]